MPRIGTDVRPLTIDGPVTSGPVTVPDSSTTPALTGTAGTPVWTSGADARVRPVSELLTELSTRSLAPDEREAIATAGAEAARTGKPLESFLPAPLAQKRTEILSLESEGLGAALGMAKRDPGALDPLVDKLAAGVSATGVDASPRASLDRLVKSLDAEHWQETGKTRFSLAETLQRAQGVASDETGGLYFSGNFSLSRTGGGDGDASKLLAIPKELRKLGANHIGDIDVAGGKLYAPIEDGPAYKHPNIAIFDAKTLEVQKIVPLPLDLQPDGVPYVAVDAKAGRLYSSSYEDPTKLNVYDLNDGLKPLPGIELSQSLHHVQGAVVKDGMLYATCDDAQKSLYKVNLRTGTAMKVGELGAGEREIEGLAVSAGPKGPSLRVLALDANKGTFFKKLQHERAGVTSFEVDQPSVRDQLARP